MKTPIGKPTSQPILHHVLDEREGVQYRLAGRGRPGPGRCLDGGSRSAPVMTPLICASALGDVGVGAPPPRPVARRSTVVAAGPSERRVSRSTGLPPGTSRAPPGPLR